jgi:TATA-box binding protein (TBP) (component of TFIID and TFIIIB)
VFSSGKVVFLGYKSEQFLDHGVRDLKDKLGRFLQFLPESKLQICNVVLSFKLGFSSRVNLQKLCCHLNAHLSAPSKAEYHPELSNNVTIRFPDSSRVLIHATGSGIATGSPMSATLEDRIALLNELCVQFS